MGVMRIDFPAINAVDAFALSMLGVIGLAFGTITMLFVCMRRAASRRDPHVDALLEEVERETLRQGQAGAGGHKREPWERGSDWWRK